MYHEEETRKKSIPTPESKPEDASITPTEDTQQTDLQPKKDEVQAPSIGKNISRTKLRHQVKKDSEAQSKKTIENTQHEIEESISQEDKAGTGNTESGTEGNTSEEPNGATDGPGDTENQGSAGGDGGEPASSTRGEPAAEQGREETPDATDEKTEDGSGQPGSEFAEAKSESQETKAAEPVRAEDAHKSDDPQPGKDGAQTDEGRPGVVTTTIYFKPENTPHPPALLPDDPEPKEIQVEVDCDYKTINADLLDKKEGTQKRSLRIPKLMDDNLVAEFNYRTVTEPQLTFTDVVNERLAGTKRFTKPEIHAD